MKLKKKYFLIAFCTVALFVIVSTAVERISRKADEKERERMHDLYEQLAAERPDTFALTNVVEPAFIKKYDYLTESNLNEFINDWKTWSKELRSFSSDSHVNEAIGKIVTIYSKTEHEDSCKFYSLPSDVTVSIYPCKLEDYTKNDTPNLKPIISAAKHYAYYIPDFKADKDIVYVSPEIEKILSSYVGGVSESEKYEYGSPLTPINEGYAIGGKSDRISKYPLLVRDVNGDSFYMYTNTMCTYRYDGERLPQGSGKLSGVIVHERFSRFEWENGKDLLDMEIFPELGNIGT